MTNSITDQPSSQPTLKGKKRKQAEPQQNIVPKRSKTASTSETSVDALQSPKTEWNTKITTWNVAGLRAAVKKNCLEYLIAENSDIICLQVKKLLRSSPCSKILIFRTQNCRKQNVWRSKYRLRSMKLRVTTSIGEAKREAKLVFHSFPKY